MDRILRRWHGTSPRAQSKLLEYAGRVETAYQTFGLLPGKAFGGLEATHLDHQLDSSTCPSVCKDSI